jgi:hypothetical protein
MRGLCLSLLPSGLYKLYHLCWTKYYPILRLKKFPKKFLLMNLGLNKRNLSGNKSCRIPIPVSLFPLKLEKLVQNFKVYYKIFFISFQFVKYILEDFLLANIPLSYIGIFKQIIKAIKRSSINVFPRGESNGIFILLQSALINFFVCFNCFGYALWSLKLVA